MSDTSEQTEFRFPRSSVADSPAKISRSPERAPASTGSGRGFGANSPESFVTFDPGSSSWKTSPLSDGEGSESFSGTWPRAGMMRRGIACPQQPSAPRTKGTGSSWSRGEYPTPSAVSYGTSQNEGKVEHSRPATAGTPSLETWARAGGPSAEPKGPAWPTPLARERPKPGQDGPGRRTVGLATTAKRAGSWPTPTNHDAKGGTGATGFGSLARDARHWPTPTCGDMRRSGSRVENAETKAHPGTSLTDATCRPGLPGLPTCPHGPTCPRVLNPRFVLWLMGFPPTWFDPLFERPVTLSLFPSGK